MTEKSSIRDAVEYLVEYWGTYARQHGYINYSVETLIDDALYGLGMAIDEKQFRFADGYDRFKKVLSDHLERSEGAEIKKFRSALEWISENGPDDAYELREKARDALVE